MPLGDSITQGAVGYDSYRRPLWKKLQKAGLSVDFVGSMHLSYPYGKPLNSDFDMDHEGHWGWRADEVLANIDSWAAKAAPDVVLIHLGTNDIMQRQKNEQTVEELRQIVQVLRKQNPHVSVLLAQIIPVAGTTVKDEILKFNELLLHLAEAMTTTASLVQVVNHFYDFDPSEDTYDGIHPNESGIEKMARRWYDALDLILHGYGNAGSA